MGNVKSTVGETLNCGWHKCGKPFVVTQAGQKFCPGGKCKDAHNNWLKMTGIHFIPHVYFYIQGIANSRIPPISVDEMANEMMLTIIGHTAEELKPNERPGEYLKTLEGLDT